MNRLDDAQLLDRLDRRLAAIEAEIPPPPRWRGSTPTRSQGRRVHSVFSASRLAVAGVLVALSGSLLLIAQHSAQRPAVPGASTGEAGVFSPAGTYSSLRPTATLLHDGRVLVVGTSVSIWDPETETFGPAGLLAVGRAGHTASLLPDGRVLVIGGCGSSRVCATAEVWDPATETFGPAGSLLRPRVAQTATPLPDGRVLIVGGWADDVGFLRSAEVWDPTTETFGPAGTLGEARTLHTATLLPDGRVLVVGGWTNGVLRSAEVWDPTTETFGPAGTLAEARAGHTASLLSDGRVLFVGGESHDESTLASAEMWIPATETFGPADVLAQPRTAHTATTLADGRVLIVGGGTLRPEDGVPDPAAEIWDPATETFGPAGSLAEARWLHAATGLADGRVLVAGGERACPSLPCRESFVGYATSAEMWRPSGE